jgi:outer membrane receptor protein involved in Fe transport
LLTFAREQRRNFAAMKITLRLFAMLFFVLLVQCAMAQPGSQQGAPPIGTVIGIVSDSATGQKIEYASVAVIAVADSSVKGGSITGADGSFSVTKLPPGTFRVRVTFMGYKEWYSVPFTISMMNTQYDAGAVKIKPSDTQLGTVVIEEQRSDYTNSIDKKVYDVNQNIVNTGGTATDVLQNIPSVTVDVDGNVSLRGSANVTILIDGKPSGMTGEDKQAVLAQIPASMIERIEVITNPSARYDAQGMAGIINIVLKKEKGKGYNGTISGGVGTGNKYNGSLNLNMRRDKANFFGSYSYRYEDRWGSSFGYQNTATPDTSYRYDSNGGSLTGNQFHSGRIGSDIYFNPYNTLSISTGYAMRKELKNDSTHYYFFDSSDSLTSDFSRLNGGYDQTNTIDAALDYRKSFPGSKRTFSSAASFTTNQRSVLNTFKLNSYGYENEPYQTNKANNEYYNVMAQADYSYPVSDSFRLETGVKYNYRQYSNLQAGYMYNYASEIYTSDPRFADHFKYDENVGAAYVQMSMHRGKLDYLAGVRAEYTYLTGSSSSQDTTFTKNYLNLFPNASVRFTTATGTEMQLSYGRRLNRPGNWNLNPYIDYSDSINLRTGNPYLNPEFIHSFDFTIARVKMKYMWSFTLYYRHSENVITHVRTFDVLTNRALVKPVNYTSAENYGVEYVLRVPFSKKGNVMLSGSAYLNQVNGDNVDPALQSSAFHYNARLSFSYKIFKPTTVQISGMYFSPFVNPVGSFWMKGGMDVGVRQDIFKGKAQLSANLTDAFNTREFVVTNESDEYIFKGGRKRESMVLMLSFSWRFGSNDEISKRKTQINAPVEEMPQGGF